MKTNEGQKWYYAVGTIAALGLTAFLLGSRPGSWFLPVPPGSLCFVFACGCCSESEDSLQQPVRERVLFFFLELRVHLCALHSVHNSLLLHLANRASFTCKTDSFSWGHGPDALACKARPSSDQCGTSLSVSCHVMPRKTGARDDTRLGPPQTSQPSSSMAVPLAAPTRRPKPSSTASCLADRGLYLRPSKREYILPKPVTTTTRLDDAPPGWTIRHDGRFSALGGRLRSPSRPSCSRELQKKLGRAQTLMTQLARLLSPAAALVLLGALGGILGVSISNDSWLRAQVPIKRSDLGISDHSLLFSLPRLVHCHRTSTQQSLGKYSATPDR